jgi:hypothetical protein
MDKIKCHGTAQLNICNDSEVNRLSVALDCRPTEVYDAIAMVGDCICCIRAHLRKTTPPIRAPHEGVLLLNLPPLWDALAEQAALV